MITIPAIDISQKKVVRLTQGKMENKKEYSIDPVEQALIFKEKGVRMIHVVDLDGAFEGSLKNMDVIEKIVEETMLPIEVGGGIRSEELVEKLLDIGVKRVIIGTMAIEEPKTTKQILKKFGGDRVVIAVDAEDGFVVTHGWQKKTKILIEDVIENYRSCGLKTVLYTDIKQDGMLKGVNFEAVERLLDKISGKGVKIIVSGGVSSIDDISRIKALEYKGIEGYIIGKAYYEGKIDLEQAIKVAGG